MINYNFNSYLKFSVIDPNHVVEQFTNDGFIHAIIDQGLEFEIRFGYRYVVASFEVTTLLLSSVKNTCFSKNTAIEYLSQFKPKIVVLFEDQ